MVAASPEVRQPRRLSPLVKACAQYRDYHIAPRSIDGNDWTVISQSGTEYVVDTDRQTCTCPAFAQRHRLQETTCKHIEVVRLHRASGDAPALSGICLPVNPLEDPFRADALATIPNPELGAEADEVARKRREWNALWGSESEWD